MPDAPAFTHLHVHTHYSLLDGACKVPDLVKRAKSLGMDSLAISDHGCMFGVIEFYNECKKEGIKPIIGMEAYIAPTSRTERAAVHGETAFHLLLLAQDLEGYRNLVKLSSTAYREGFYYKPRIDKDVLRQLNRGIIGTSACLGGEVAQALLHRDTKNARKIAETYLDIFGPDRFFIEVQKQGLADQDRVNPELAEIANKLGCGIVATNDVHFLAKDDHHAHDVLCCISMNKQVNDEARMKYPTELYLKSPAEMAAAMADFPEAISNTRRIADMCKLELDFSKRYAPVYRVQPDVLAAIPAPAVVPDKPIPDDERYLRELCERGLDWRYGTRDVSPAVRSRLDYELKVIAAKNFCSYFLIVWDFCNYARENGIPVGARGSGVGTMVGYLLGLCNVDPIQYSLLFERFMDPSRSEMPDIDIDICQDGRGKVIEYVRNKYGHVAQIITFGTLAAKAACKDVGRVLGVPLQEIDKLTKMIPGTPGMSLEKAVKSVPELADLYNANANARKVIDLAKKLEGMCRNAGCHAAGVIIADQPLDDVVPLYKDSDDNILTQFEGPIAEKCGLLKMDFLGLRTLSTLERALDLEKATRNIRPYIPGVPQPGKGTHLDNKNRIDIERISFADDKVLKLFCRGETRGIFQFESGGMQDLLMKMQPDRLEDLIAAAALYRPGPMELIPSYCARKHGREPVPHTHPIMDELLKETYGIMTYQEQVMQIFNQLGGIELAAAYKLIKAISKKTADVIAKFKPDFLKGTQAKGVSKEKAEELFELIQKFAGYGFNKSHSTRYAIVAFQTAFMKTYFPVEFMAATLTFESGNTDKVVEYIEECRRLTLPDGGKGVRVLPPDVNFSDRDFTPVYVEPPAAPGKGKRKLKDAPQPKEGVIRFGLTAVRGVGEKAVDSIIAERNKNGPFKDLADFCYRIDTKAVSKSVIEALIKCGAFASMPGHRAQLLAAVEQTLDSVAAAKADRAMGQLNMFAMMSGNADAANAGSVNAPPLPNVAELDPSEALKYEKELLGFYITSHPLAEHEATIERYVTATTKDALRLPEGTEIWLGVMLTRVKKSMTKNGKAAGKMMAMVTMEDLDGQIDGVIFAETLEGILKAYPDAVAVETIVFARGKVDRKRETPSIMINEILPMDAAIEKLTTNVGIKLDGNTPNAADAVTKLKSLLASHKGTREVYVQIATTAGPKVSVRVAKELSVKPSRSFLNDAELLVGKGNITLNGEGSRRAKAKAEQARLFAEPAIEEPTHEPELMLVGEEEM